MCIYGQGISIRPKRLTGRSSRSVKGMVKWQALAARTGNLGLIYRTRGELDRTEEMHKKSLAIEEKLGRLARSVGPVPRRRESGCCKLDLAYPAQVHTFLDMP